MKTKKLICINNLQGQTLQTLKWYKGTYEFYRYEPGNYPEQKKFFSLPELYLDVSIGKILISNSPHPSPSRSTDATVRAWCW